MSHITMSHITMSQYHPQMVATLRMLDVVLSPHMMICNSFSRHTQAAAISCGSIRHGEEDAAQDETHQLPGRCV